MGLLPLYRVSIDLLGTVQLLQVTTSSISEVEVGPEHVNITQ
jgi:hypothetical protein